MIKTIFLIAQLLILTFSNGCTSSKEGSDFKFEKGNYKFNMKDSTGKTILKGTLSMTEMDKDNNISGTYKITNVYDKDFPGLPTMEGKFAGNIIPAEKIVFINTNPRIADSNVFWNMVIKSNSVSGDWNYSVFRGSSWKGKITITK